MDNNLLVKNIQNFINQSRIDPNEWGFKSAIGGTETLYASCFASMLYHYLGLLDKLTPVQKSEWADYLKSWQDPISGYFIGPELVREELNSPMHSYDHIASHLTAHVLPALALLNDKPNYPLSFALPYLDLDYLRSWLEKRDWRKAWLEGNNLLFAGQFLIYLRDTEKHSSVQEAIDLFFDWLDREQDPATGLWGTNGYCSNAQALYGGYHQLLVYYYESRPVRFRERLIDVALSLQHEDGGFNLHGGGGACEDADAVDILVNMYKQINYRRSEIRIALRKSLQHILLRQMPDGGFVYLLDRPFIHMGVQKTQSPANQSNLFPTWFRVHTLALISEILTDEPALQREWQFNNSCSMGWHPAWSKSQHKLSWMDRQNEFAINGRRQFRKKYRSAFGKIRNFGSKLKKQLF